MGIDARRFNSCILKFQTAKFAIPLLKGRKKPIRNVAGVQGFSIKAHHFPFASKS